MRENGWPFSRSYGVNMLLQNLRILRAMEICSDQFEAWSYSCFQQATSKHSPSLMIVKVAGSEDYQHMKKEWILPFV